MAAGTQAAAQAVPGTACRATAQRTARLAAVRARLDQVTDPELDEPVTDLGFIERILITADGVVGVAFRLPTYWCSANFAFMMAEDIRDAVRALPWVRAVCPLLRDHMAAREVNRGVRRGLSFGQAFHDFEAGTTLEDLRATFRRKAFQRRQEAVLLALARLGFDAAALSGLTLGRLDRLDLGPTEGARQKPRYRALLVELGLARGPDDLAFVDPDGRPIAPGGITDHLRRLRAVRINMEFTGALCRGLLAARYRDGYRDGYRDDGDARAACAGACGGCAAPAAGPAVLGGGDHGENAAS